MLVAVVVVPIRTVGNLASLFSLLGFVVVNAAVVRLRRQQPDLRRPFEIPYYPIPPVLGIVFNLLLGLFIDPVTWLLALGWLAFGAGVYLLLQRRGLQPDPAEAVGPELDPDVAVAEPERDVDIADSEPIDPDS
jgi:amino acid transporter